MVLKTAGDIFQAIRVLNKESYADVAKRTGLHPIEVSEICNNKTEITLDNLDNMLAMFMTTRLSEMCI